VGYICPAGHDRVNESCNINVCCVIIKIRTYCVFLYLICRPNSQRVLHSVCLLLVSARYKLKHIVLGVMIRRKPNLLQFGDCIEVIKII
jgi:hypothetical protein